MENMIVMAIKAKASFKEFENDTLIMFNESELNDFINIVSLEIKKDIQLNNERD